MIDDIVIKLIETQGVPTVLLLLVFYQLREMNKSMDEKMCKMLDAIIAEMKEDDEVQPPKTGE